LLKKPLIELRNNRLTSVGKTGFNAVTTKVSNLTTQPKREEKPAPPPERRMTKEERSTQEYETMLHEAMTQDFSDLVSLNLVYESGTFPLLLSFPSLTQQITK